MVMIGQWSSSKGNSSMAVISFEQSPNFWYSSVSLTPRIKNCKSLPGKRSQMILQKELDFNEGPFPLPVSPFEPRKSFNEQVFLHALNGIYLVRCHTLILLSVSGSGDNSRSSQMFISYGASSSLGKAKWVSFYRLRSRRQLHLP